MAREVYNTVFTGPACPFAAELIVKLPAGFGLILKGRAIGLSLFRT